MAMSRVMAIAGLLTGLWLAGVAAGPALAQSRVIVPIVIQAPPRVTAPSAGTPSIHVTTRMASPQPGVTSTQVTVQDTTGAGRTVGLPPAMGVTKTVPVGTPSVLVTVDRRAAPSQPGVVGQTRVIVKDVSQSSRTLGGTPAVAPLQAAGRGQQTLIITSDAPIDAPIVILAP
jgi:hypothetical protein